MSKPARSAKKREVLDSATRGEVTARQVDAALRSVHVVPCGEKSWEVRVLAGGKKVERTFRRREPAVRWAHELAAKSRVAVVVHGRDGRIDWDSSPRSARKSA